MECPKCGHELPDTAKFCIECGYKIEITCPDCQTKNIVAAKFCIECGYDLTLTVTPTTKELTFEEKLDKVRRYLPKDLTEKILSQRGKIEGERKQVTVMFCDLEGFTPLVEKIGADEAYTIMDQVYELLIHAVHDYEGTVNEMTGDGIMALFGAPVALEDAPQRAIRSALAIHRQIALFNDKLKTEKKELPLLRMRVGIHSGPVVVGTLGNDLRVEFKAVGDTVNLASRMEQLAESGATYITEDTYKLTKGLFRFEALGAIDIKGKEEPVHTFRVITTSSIRTRFDVNAEQGLTPLVGRERELEILLDGFEMAKSGRGQAFSIVGEAGGGKSRLLYEFRKAIANEDQIVLEGKCLSYGRNIAYLPIMDVVRVGFDLQEEDGPDSIRDKLENGLDTIEADKTKTLPYLLELLSLENTGIDPSRSSPHMIREGIAESLQKIVWKRSEIKPLIMIIEDLHWIDQNSNELLRDLLEIVPGKSLLLIFTYRPEYQENWSRKSYFNQVNLHRFSSRESTLMLSHLLGQNNITADLHDLVLEKTEGTPFFMEEFIKSLLDLEIIEIKNDVYRLASGRPNIEIPSTIQDVIMAKVDSLAEETRNLIYKASVIEREFGYELIKRISDLSEKELLAQLSVLTESELIYERGFHPEIVYIFKHSLTRELIYNSILPARKRAIHEKIGQAMEALYQDNISDYYAILANHYTTSENFEKGEVYSRAAAKKAQKQSDFNNAIYFTKNRVLSVEKLPQAADQQKKLIDARTSLGRYYLQMNYDLKAKEAIDPIVNLVENQGDKRRLAQINTIMGSYYHVIEGNHPKAIEYHENALKLAEEENDFASISLASLFLGATYGNLGEFNKSLESLEKALHISQAADRIFGIAQLKGVISYYVYNPTGQLDLAYQTSQEGVRLAEESGDAHSKAITYICHGRSNLYKGYLDQAVEFLGKGTELCEKIAHDLWNMNGQIELFSTYIELGEYKNALLHGEKAGQLANRKGLSVASVLNAFTLMSDIAKIFDRSLSVDVLSLNTIYEGIKKSLLEVPVPSFFAEVLIKADQPQYVEAEKWIEKSVVTYEKYSLKGWSWKPYVLYFEFYKHQNDLPKAREQMNKAISIMKECGADGWVERYEKELKGRKTMNC